MDYLKNFCVKPGSKVDLDKIDPDFSNQHESHKHALPEIEHYVKKMQELHYPLYAEDRRSLLIVLQGRDAAKKEAVHDFRKRYHKATPNRLHGSLFPQTINGFVIWPFSK